MADGSGSFQTEAAIKGAGVILRAPSGECLFLQRSADADHPRTWCWPGGSPEPGEDADETALREAEEEVGFAADGSLAHIDSRDGFTTFLIDVPAIFEPKLNDEHTNFIWSRPSHPPEPLHPGVSATLTDADDLVTRLIEDTAPLAQDVAPRPDDLMALDRDSVRRLDQDGRLHVAVSHISKANVCPYFGREIPQWRTLGLDPERIYQLLRDPVEMAKPKTVASFNNLPILSKHVPVTTKTNDGHQSDLVIGSTGTDAAFNDPYMDNSLVFWAKHAVDDIDAERKEELSSAYYYRADMTSGVFKGVRFDGVMRDILANHLCHVEDGRAGDDVVVMDSALVQSRQGSLTTAATDSKEITMTKTVLTRKAALVQGALHVFLKPMLALDAQIDLGPALKGVGPKNYKSRKAGIVTAVKLATDGKLAQDADIEDVVKLLDSLDGVMPAEDTDEADGLLTAGAPLDGDEPAGEDDDPCAKVLALLDDKVPADVLGQIKSILQPQAAADEDDEVAERPTENDGGANSGTGAADEEDDKDMVTKTAMDAALKSVAASTADKIRREQKDLRSAEAFVRPWVGDLVAMDSAEAVYRGALKVLKVDVTGVHASALPTILKMQPLPGVRRDAQQSHIAMDAKAAASYAERFPGADHIRSL